MSAREPSILCEIHAPRAAQAAALAEIALTCALDVGQSLTVKKLTLGSDPDSPSSTEPVLTLHLPVELAIDQHRIWCLACRLACFCPGARVGVLVRSEALFAPPAGSASPALPPGPSPLHTPAAADAARRTG